MTESFAQQSPDKKSRFSVNGGKLYWSGLLFEIGLLVLTISLGAPFGIWPLANISLNLTDLSLGAAAAVPLLAFYFFAARLRTPSFRTLRRLTRQFVRLCLVPKETGWLLRSFLLSATAGICEEAFFRGLIQIGLSDIIGGIGGKGAALIIASLLFGLAHVLTPIYFTLAAGVGFYFGFLLLLTGNWFVCAVAHALYDFIVIIVVIKQFSKSRKKLVEK